jgi:hypothetical protein
MSCKKSSRGRDHEEKRESFGTWTGVEQKYVKNSLFLRLNWRLLGTDQEIKKDKVMKIVSDYGKEEGQKGEKSPSQEL